MKDHAKRFKKTVRIKKQNKEWDKLESEAGIVPERHRNEISSKKLSKKKSSKKVPKKLPKKKDAKKKPSKKKSPKKKVLKRK